MLDALAPWINAAALLAGGWLGDRILRFLERRGLVYYRGDRS